MSNVLILYLNSSLRSPDQQVQDAVDPEAKKFEEEFEQYQQKLKTQKDQWAKDNPEEVSFQKF